MRYISSSYCAIVCQPNVEDSFTTGKGHNFPECKLPKFAIYEIFFSYSVNKFNINEHFPIFTSTVFGGFPHIKKDLLDKPDAK